MIPKKEVDLRTIFPSLQRPVVVRLSSMMVTNIGRIAAAMPRVEGDRTAMKLTALTGLTRCQTLDALGQIRNALPDLEIKFDKARKRESELIDLRSVFSVLKDREQPMMVEAGHRLLANLRKIGEVFPSITGEKTVATISPAAGLSSGQTRDAVHLLIPFLKDLDIQYEISKGVKAKPVDLSTVFTSLPKGTIVKLGTKALEVLTKCAAKLPEIHGPKNIKTLSEATGYEEDQLRDILAKIRPYLPQLGIIVLKRGINKGTDAYTHNVREYIASLDDAALAAVSEESVDAGLKVEHIVRRDPIEFISDAVCEMVKRGFPRAKIGEFTARCAETSKRAVKTEELDEMIKAARKSLGSMFDLEQRTCPVLWFAEKDAATKAKVLTAMSGLASLPGKQSSVLDQLKLGKNSSLYLRAVRQSCAMIETDGKSKDIETVSQYSGLGVPTIRTLLKTIGKNAAGELELIKSGDLYQDHDAAVSLCGDIYVPVYMVRARSTQEIKLKATKAVITDAIRGETANFYIIQTQAKKNILVPFVRASNSARYMVRLSGFIPRSDEFKVLIDECDVLKSKFEALVEAQYSIIASDQDLNTTLGILRGDINHLELVLPENHAKGFLFLRNLGRDVVDGIDLLWRRGKENEARKLLPPVERIAGLMQKAKTQIMEDKARSACQTVYFDAVSAYKAAYDLIPEIEAQTKDCASQGMYRAANQINALRKKIRPALGEDGIKRQYYQKYQAAMAGEDAQEELNSLLDDLRNDAAEIPEGKYPGLTTIIGELIIDYEQKLDYLREGGDESLLDAGNKEEY